VLLQINIALGLSLSQITLFTWNEFRIFFGLKIRKCYAEICFVFGYTFLVEPKIVLLMQTKNMILHLKIYRKICGIKNYFKNCQLPYAYIFSIN